MMIQAGNTQYFVVSYDDSLANGLPLAQAVLASCDADYGQLSALFGGIALFNTPSQNIYTLCTVNLVPGAGGGSNNLVQEIDINVNANSDGPGVSSIVVAELAEIFMNKQAKGWMPAWSNGEALSRVLATVLYPQLASRWAVGNNWMNAAGRPDWVDSTKPTDQDFPSMGCGTLFLNYLAHQLGYSWDAIVQAGALPGKTLNDTASQLGESNAFASFKALLEQYFPSSQTTQLPDDNPFPLGKRVKIPKRWEAMWQWLIGSLADGPLWAIGPHGPVPVDPWGPMVAQEVREARRAMVASIKTLQRIGKRAASGGPAAARRKSGTKPAKPAARKRTKNKARKRKVAARVRR